MAWRAGRAGPLFLVFPDHCSDKEIPKEKRKEQEKDQDYELVSLVVRVLNEVDHKYVKPLDYEAKRKLVEDMVDGGLDALSRACARGTFGPAALIFLRSTYPPPCPAPRPSP